MVAAAAQCCRAISPVKLLDHRFFTMKVLVFGRNMKEPFCSLHSNLVIYTNGIMLNQSKVFLRLWNSGFVLL